ncbi:unannotated protein [freshwater metagenome]|uniref:Unannotated protein n=1 Tax=freshwater metagenome TaxID=449393 RepID=A0A6J7HQ57_9ZZZZ|nr:hypothetical protein [Actinomycetota bacterium]
MPVETLRDGVLGGLHVVDTGAPSAVVARCAALGAQVHPLDPGAGELAMAEVAAALPGAVAVVAGVDLQVEPGEALARAWEAVRAVVAGHLIPSRFGRVVLIAPAPGAHAQALEIRAALDNLARTTGVEWARHGIRVVAVLPGDATPPDVLAELVAYVISPAGDYISGTSIELDALA